MALCCMSVHQAAESAVFAMLYKYNYSQILLLLPNVLTLLV